MILCNLPVFSPCFGEADIYYQEYADVYCKRYLRTAVRFIILAHHYSLRLDHDRHTYQSTQQVRLTFEAHQRGKNHLVFVSIHFYTHQKAYAGISYYRQAYHHGYAKAKLQELLGPTFVSAAIFTSTAPIAYTEPTPTE